MNFRGMDGEVERGVVFLNTTFHKRGSVIRRVHDVCGVVLTGIFVFFCGVGVCGHMFFFSFIIFTSPRPMMHESRGCSSEKEGIV